MCLDYYFPVWIEWNICIPVSLKSKMHNFVVNDWKSIILDSLTKNYYYGVDLGSGTLFSWTLVGNVSFLSFNLSEVQKWECFEQHLSNPPLVGLNLITVPVKFLGQLQ